MLRGRGSPPATGGPALPGVQARERSALQRPEEVLAQRLEADPEQQDRVRRIERLRRRVLREALDEAALDDEALVLVAGEALHQHHAAEPEVVLAGEAGPPEFVDLAGDAGRDLL